jgi:hypothetical protein
MTVAGPLAALAALATLALPYPAPRSIQANPPTTKCDRATVILVDTAKGEMKGSTKAGTVTYRVSLDVQVFDKEGKPFGGVGRLTQGTNVLVYYVVDDGAKVLEIDVAP